jgi:CheY-like chemotaxis protein
LAALRKLSPGTPVILASGYNEAEVMAGAHPDRPEAFLAKPYITKELDQVLSQVLES